MTRYLAVTTTGVQTFEADTFTRGDNGVTFSNQETAVEHGDSFVGFVPYTNLVSFEPLDEAVQSPELPDSYSKQATFMEDR
jgi:hypothetical protein